ncbi:hypothetical protein [Brachyspira hyodysenteriae]|nr:hypothetical protein [Brachyspira hyodysenteriae]
MKDYKKEAVIFKAFCKEGFEKAKNILNYYSSKINKDKKVKTLCD